MIAGDFSFACLNRSLTRLAPTPTNISTKSDPDNEKNGTFASPATAFASSVFPVPGGPTSIAPLGIFPPNVVYFFGDFKKSTISVISSFASSNPATSLKVTFTFSLSINFPCVFPILNICPADPPPPILFMINIHIKIKKAKGKIQESISPNTSLRVS